MADLRLTPAALRDLEGIWDYTVERWGTAQAVQYLDRLNEAFQQLAQAPDSGQRCDAIRPGYRRRWVEQHAVYYQLRGSTLVVVRVLHQRMDAARHM